MARPRDFDDLGLYIFTTEDEARAFVKAYR